MGNLTLSHPCVAVYESIKNIKKNNFYWGPVKKYIGGDKKAPSIRSFVHKKDPNGKRINGIKPATLLTGPSKSTTNELRPKAKLYTL